MKNSQADVYFAKCVKARANYTCERCGIQSDFMDNSHNYTRKFRTIRWCGLNALCLCRRCHNWYENNKEDSRDWLRNKIGDGAFNLLIEKRNSNIKIYKSEEKEIAKHYKNELKKIEEKRNQGEQGYIDFISWQ